MLKPNTNKVVKIILHTTEAEKSNVQNFYLITNNANFNYKLMFRN
jgi:hypothetical protein